MNEPSGQANRPHGRRWSFGVVLIAALIPLIPLVAGFILTSTGANAGTVSSGAFKSVAKAPATTPHTVADRLPPGSGALVVLVTRNTVMRTAPGGHVFARIGTRTEFGSPTAFWVVQHSPKWLGVVSPEAGNGRIGWIPRSATSLGRVDWVLRVSLSARRLTVIENGKVRERFTVAIGQPAAPTPTGRFAVTDRLATHDPTGPYGCCILALSAEAPHAIQDWNGGNRIAIHSTPDTGSIGQAVSHGCLRLTLAEGQWLLDHIPLGTPTYIRT